MTNKRYKNRPSMPDHFEAVLYESGDAAGELLVFVYDGGRCCMSHCYWGTELDYDYSRDGEVEHLCLWDEENTKKLMLRTGTHSGEELVQSVYNRFHAGQSSADRKIKEWCTEKGVEYRTQVWY